MYMNCCHTICHKESPFPHWIALPPLSKINWPHLCGSIPGLYSVLVELCLFLYTVHAETMLCWFLQLYSKSWNLAMWRPSTLLFFKNGFGYYRSFVSPFKLTCQFLQKKNSYCHLVTFYPIDWFFILCITLNNVLLSVICLFPLEYKLHEEREIASCFFFFLYCISSSLNEGIHRIGFQ